MDRAAYTAGRYEPVVRWADTRFGFAVHPSDGAVEIVCRALDLEKRFHFAEDGAVSVRYRLTGRAPERSTRFTTEISFTGACRIEASHDPERWSYEIETVAQSERGIERTRQGTAVLLRWPIERVGPALAGEGVTVALRPGGGGASSTGTEG